MTARPSGAVCSAAQRDRQHTRDHRGGCHNDGPPPACAAFERGVKRRAALTPAGFREGNKQNCIGDGNPGRHNTRSKNAQRVTGDGRFGERLISTSLSFFVKRTIDDPTEQKRAMCRVGGTSGAPARLGGRTFAVR